MIIIDTPFHITFSSWSAKPQYACTGKCKKSWWPKDFQDNPTMGLCPMCKNGLTNAVEGVHYKIIEQESRNLTIADIRKFVEPGLSDQGTDRIEMILKNGGEIGHGSVVKSKFIERAINQWEGHKKDVSITLTFK
jgi:hypothetical protein